MTFGSVCSGIEAASVAWGPLGWRSAFFAEIDKFPCALLQHYHPAVPNFGDLNDYEKWPQRSIDVLVGGTPCQDFSIAGLRAGLAGDRGGLTMRFLDIVGRYAPAWVLWENVPGVLSIDGGRAFGSFLGGLAKRGYGFAYRVLDAQYSGLAQRRERVFVVGCSGGRWQRAAAVLFDAPRLRWNPPPGRETGKRVAPTVEGRAGRSGANNFATSGGLVETAPTIGTRNRGGGGLGTDAECDGALVATITKNYATMHGRTSGNNGGVAENQLVATIDANFGRLQGASGQDANHGHSHFIAHGMAVRRLTPREVERLFGFPDDYTLIPYRGKLACDGPRYRALGNSMAVPVIRWIGRRIALNLPC